MFLSGDNKIHARGRLSKNPIVNFSDSGNAVTTITVALKTPFKKNGENKVVFIDYVAISTSKDNIADRLAEYVTKGSLISLEGYLDNYKNKQINRITGFRNEESKEKTLQRRRTQEGER